MMIKSVEKCMQIMSVISDGHAKPVSVAEIAARTGIPKPTCMHILGTLVEGGYAERISHTQGYILGASTYYLTRFGKYNQSFVSACRPVTRWLYKETGFPIVLAVIQGSRKYVIDYVNAYSFTEKPEEDIFTDDIYRTATGRMILAHMSDPEVEHIYSHYGPPNSYQWPQVRSLETMKKKLGEIRKQPYIRTENSVIKRTNTTTLGYAMPIFEHYACIGALGVSARYEPGEEEIFLKSREPKILTSLGKATREINRRMKYNG